MLLLLTALFPILIILQVQSSICSAIPHSEVSALHDLHNNTGGELWVWLDEELYGPRWNFTLDSDGLYLDNPCSSSRMTWQGVTCSNITSICVNEICHVTRIILQSYNLAGTLPAGLASLTSLEQLTLSRNSLVGPIPAAVGYLTALSHFDLSRNSLTSTIPPEIYTMSSLVRLIFHINQLTGPVSGDFVSNNILDLVLYSNLVSFGHVLWTDIYIIFANIVQRSV